MKHFKRLALFVLLSAFFAAQTAADNREKPGNMPMPPSPPSILSLASDLDFTAEQITKLVYIEKNSKKLTLKIQEEFKKLMKEMQNEMDKDTPDHAKIYTIIDKMSLNHGAMMKTMIEDMLSIKAVLTKDQNKKMKNLFNKNAPGRQGRPIADDMDKPGGPR